MADPLGIDQAEAAATIEATKAVETPEVTETPDATSETPETTESVGTEEVVTSPMHKIKIDGVESEVSIEDLIKGYQTGASSNTRFEQAASREVELESIATMMLNDPIAAYERLHPGETFRSFAEKYIVAALEEEALPEDQRAVVQAKRELADINAQKEAAAQEQHQTKQAAEVAKFTEHYAKLSNEAIIASGVPDSTFLRARSVHYLQQAVQQNIEVSPEELGNILKEDYAKEISGAIGGHSMEELYAVLGEKGIENLRKMDVAALRNKGKLPETPAAEAQPVPTKKEKRPDRTIKDFEKDLDAIEFGD